MSFSLALARSLTEVEAVAWDALTHPDEPFMDHAFLLALEQSGSVGADTGWRPFYLLVREGAGGVLAGACAVYLKEHSYGEYIFDWAWADACRRHGLAYYPKLVVAAPFTPATGRRLLFAPWADAQAVRAALVQGLLTLAQQTGASGAHCLFVQPQEQTFLAELGFSPRMGLQFHWRNRGYKCFDDYLQALTQKRRKEVRRERRMVMEAGVAFEVKRGDDATHEEWQAMRRFYLDTVAKKGGHPYLTAAFFEQTRQHWGHRAVLVLARREGRLAAGALNFHKGRHLYGRYWGCDEDMPGLHFETCYYQAIEFAIAQQLTLVEAGAQGEHKLARGFEAQPVYSAHTLFHPGLARAVGDFVAQETARLDQALAYYRHHSPYQQVPCEAR